MSHRLKMRIKRTKQLNMVGDDTTRPRPAEDVNNELWMVFVKLCTFISTNTKCTCVPTQGTEVSVFCLWACG